ncbi:Pyruvate/ketoisovalerate oxidoreductases common subunit gamma (Includes: Pyruvate synthase subunit PorC; Ketoisovalerate oxidoreductase subunit VorC) [Syntrophobacter sp. SbD1]|nr:Pyruvate/ketoisovalerate oxidoreductases common subunit gamma (Includes: Pyruvate synthase subunit PorC; Ketoisovalerate oxidoreductase subunit VorC) [Syntrophobacter sp. SbD1]
MNVSNKYIEVRWHGRGGQGAVTAAEILAQAAFYDGYRGVTAAPFFGAERRGAPVIATNRFGREPVRTFSLVQKPAVVVVLDETILSVVNIAAGIQPDGIVLVNSTKSPDRIVLPSCLRVAVTDATRWAAKAGLIISGTVLSNTSILGGFAKATGLIGMESIEKALRSHFKGEAAERNVLGARLAFEGTVVSGNCCAEEERLHAI